MTYRTKRDIAYYMRILVKNKKEQGVYLALFRYHFEGGGLRNRFNQEKASELSMKSFFVVTSSVTVYRIPPFCDEIMFYDLKKNKKYKEMF